MLFGTLIRNFARRKNTERKLILQKITYMEKKIYVKPVLAFERFMPNEYCAACFTATGMLECEINDGVVHGYPCAHTRFTISYEKGVLTGTAQELNPNGTVKTTMDMSDINVPCGLANVESWKDEGCENTTWENNDSQGLHYNHRGKCTITTFAYTKEGHPMHS